MQELLELVLEYIVFECHTCHCKWKGEDSWFSTSKLLFCSTDCYLYY